MLWAAVAGGGSSADASTQKWVDDNRAALVREYMSLLAIPNESSDIINIRRNADHIVAMMKRRGLAPRLLEGDNPRIPPAVFGEWRVPGARRTLVLYAHYDGQPGGAADWKSTEPFKPVLRSGRLEDGGSVLPLPAIGRELDPNWRIYARSASDDKLGVMAILAAVDALKASGEKPAVNLKIFFEGEEEAGSPNLAAILAKHRDLLASDGWVMIDGPAHPSGARQVALGVRGVVSVDLTVYGPVRPLHSGHYGNWAPNPAMMLSRLLSSMKDETGRVTITGFYDDVTPLTPAERQAIAQVPSADSQLKDELGLGWTEGSGRPLAELLMEPSLNINGMRSAEAGKGARNVIPATASATLDLRLVKGNDRDRQVAKVIAHVRAQGFTVFDREPTREERRRHLMTAMVKAGSGYNAERTALDHPLARGVIDALKDRKHVVLPSVGGSLPLYLFRTVLGAPTVTLSLANHDNNQHAEDENLRLGNFWEAITTVADVMRVP